MTKTKTKPVQVEIIQLPDEGKPLPLKVSVSFELAPNDPRQQTICPALGRFLAEVFSAEEAEQFLAQYQKQATRKAR